MTDANDRMTPLELRSSFSLASIYSLRMLGLFLVLPVFALEAAHYPGGEDAVAVGLAMGIYGLTQGVLQIPFGMASDRWGRKRVIMLGLVLFSAGSVWAALATDLNGLMLGRALQGAGAVSAAVTALLADQTRDVVRTKAMALVGGSIGLMFAVSLVLAPVLAAWAGLPGLFGLTAVLALGGVAVMRWWVPAEPSEQKDPGRRGLSWVLSNPSLLRLNVGVFVLHAVQMAMWVAIPGLLVSAGVVTAHHWWVYLPTVLLSFGVLGGVLFPLERRGHLRWAMRMAIGAVALVQLGFWWAVPQPELWPLVALLLLFFCAFNMLEASQPSLASRLAPARVRGAALGVFNTLQSLGFFVGGAAGGWLVKHHGPAGVFAACAAFTVLWLVVAWQVQTQPDPVAPAPATT